MESSTRRHLLLGGKEDHVEGLYKDMVIKNSFFVRGEGRIAVSGSGIAT